MNSFGTLYFSRPDAVHGKRTKMPDGALFPSGNSAQDGIQCIEIACIAVYTCRRVRMQINTLIPGTAKLTEIEP